MAFDVRREVCKTLVKPMSVKKAKENIYLERGHYGGVMGIVQGLRSSE
jgi:hypothetical protein